MKEIKLVVFDMDGVLADTPSSWQYVHDYFGVDNTSSLNAYISGEIDDAEFTRRDVALWKKKKPDLTLADLEEILSSVEIMPGAREAISSLHRLGIETAILSGGLDILANRIAETFGIRHVLANGIRADDDGVVSEGGIIRVPLLDKLTPLENLVKDIGITLEECAAVGNSRFDLSFVKACEIGIAFNPIDEEIERSVDVVVKEKNLKKILLYI